MRMPGTRGSCNLRDHHANRHVLEQFGSGLFKFRKLNQKNYLFFKAHLYDSRKKLLFFFIYSDEIRANN